MYYAIFNILGMKGDGHPLHFSFDNKEQMLDALNNYYISMTGEAKSPYTLDDFEPEIFMGRALETFINDDWAFVTENEVGYVEYLSTLPNAVELKTIK